MSPSPPRLFIRKRARADIAEAFAWYEERSTGLGHEFLRAAHVSFAAIERDPGRFPIAVDDIRKLRLREHSAHWRTVAADGSVRRSAPPIRSAPT